MHHQGGHSATQHRHESPQPRETSASRLFLGPEVLPEIPPPDWAVPDRLCPAVHGAYRVVWAEGYEGAPLGIILDNPGLRQQFDDTAFVCPTRLTLQRALWEAQIPLTAVQVVFLFKCRPRGPYDRTLASSRFVPILAEQVRAASLASLGGG